MNSGTLLLRQIHPSFVHQGRVSSQAFRPTPKDESKLSVYDGDQIEPSAAFQHYTQELRHDSAGVLGVLVAECLELDLVVVADPDPFPEHVLIDYSAFARGQIEKKAKLLQVAATARGWLHREM